MAYQTFRTAKWIVSPNVNDGTHTTIAAALTAASSGDTIFIKPGTYTEDPTLKAGVDLVAFDCDAFTPNVTIIGNCTATFTGTCSISGIRLQTNSANLLTVSGANATIVNLIRCFLNCANNNGISYSSSNASSQISLLSCGGNIGTTGINIFDHSGANNLLIRNCSFTNTGASTTANTISGSASGPICQIFNSTIPNPITTSNKGFFQIYNSFFPLTNTTAFTVGNTGGNICQIYSTRISTGTASAITISATLNIYESVIKSSNANVITGAGTLSYGGLVFDGTSSTINTTTTTPIAFSVPQGGTGQSTLTNHGLLIGAGTSAITQSSVGATGTVLIGNTGADPTFSATPTLTSVSFGGSTLSTYVTSTFTPVLSFGGANVGITYGTQLGEYTQIGNIVHMTIHITLTSKGSSTGSATIALPVANGGTICSFASGRYSAITLTALYTNVGGYTQSNNLNLIESGSAQSATSITDAMFANTSDLYISGFYFTS